MPLLNMGMPMVGFGLWKISPEDCADTVFKAIELGYRHLDSACDYGNEKEVGAGIGRALEAGICSREDLWITSKLWNTFHDPEHVEPAAQRSLDDLGIEYFDLYLVHFPIALAYVDFVERYPPEWFYDPEAAKPVMKRAKVPLHQTWAAMESLQQAGLTRHIGVCNYNSALMWDLANYANILPAVLQIESHPYHTQERLLELCRELGIGVTAFSPLGASSYVELDMATQAESLLQHESVVQIAEKLAKSPAQVLLRWAVQRGTAIIPKSTNPSRMLENLTLGGFTLESEDVAALESLNINRRFNDPGDFCLSAFNTQYPIYD